ncbi:M23 family metallopeptidase [Streptomyces sp. ISL-90]|nr:M23 family metallopeptidase [Streptomyces sp. ISL-90]
MATRAYLAASQGDGAAMSSMYAVFGAGHDLLAGLGGVQRVAQITGDAEKLLAIASLRSDEAVAAQERAQAAWDAVDAVPVDALKAAVAEAENGVTAARAALSSVQSQVASTSLGLVDSLPRDAGQLSEQGWAAPVSGHKTDGFGPRPNKPLPGVNEFHRGTDISASCGAPVFAATGGVVLEARANGSYGNWVLIDHGAGVSTGYAHLGVGGILVSAGQTVSPGQLVGAVGSTGASTGCHLHFEVRIGGVAIDAEPFMATRGIRLG